MFKIFTKFSVIPIFLTVLFLTYLQLFEVKPVLSATLNRIALNQPTIVATLSAAAQQTATKNIVDIDLNVQSEKGPDLRKDHAKSHGLVWGEFIVEKNIPKALKVGIFSQPNTYPLWARFSNASDAQKRGKLKSDLEPDVRAVAIKLLNVSGKKVLDDERETQDFLMINHPIFFTKDVRGFANLMKATVGKANPEELQSLAPTFAVLKTITSKQVSNPLLTQYWSATPYQFGSQSIKYSVKPQQQDSSNSKPNSENYLRKAMVDSLAADGKGKTFDFLVQSYVNEAKTPIENPMQEWQETDSPFIKLATINIPAQKFDFSERKRLDEGLSFNPWHTLAAHAPLGSVNLARKQVYQAMAKARRGYIEHRSEEPQAHSLVVDDPQ
jgi:hypothetical protein